MNAPSQQLQSHPHVQACPRCRSMLLRVPRSFGDRLISLFVPMKRMRCAAGVCDWQGLVRRSAPGAPPRARSDYYYSHHVLEHARGFGTGKAPPAR